MTHFRAIAFDLIAQGKTDEEIWQAIYDSTGMDFTMPRIKNYRDTYNKLSADQREAYKKGERNLLGDQL